jgi:hypothetical protein
MALGIFSFCVQGLSQINMSMSLDRETYLLYEAIPVKVGLTNIGDQPIVLNNSFEGVSNWISFTILRSDGSKVRSEKDIQIQPLSLPVGESRTVIVDIIPVYALRETGQYTLQTVITIPGMKPFVTESRAFFIGKGDKFWSQERMENGAKRSYSLIKFLGKTESSIYARVEEPGTNTVYATQRLGRFTDFTSPVVKFDTTGALHIVHTVSGQTYRYSVIDVDGVLLKQEDRLIAGERPSLVSTENGGIKFIGGTAQQEKKVRPKLSEGQQGLM